MVRKLRFNLFFLIFLFCIIGCTPGETEEAITPAAAYPSPTLPSDLPLFFPRQQLVDGEWIRMTGERTGMLREVEGCIYLDDFLVIWPPHYSAALVGEQLQILDSSGQPLAVVGETVHMGGGEASSLDFVTVPETLEQQIPPECSGPYWISGGIIQ